MGNAEKLERLIEKGKAVLATHKPNPPNVIGFPTLEISAFTSWKTQTLAFLESCFSSTSPYYLEFSDKVKEPYQSAVQTGLGVLEAMRDEIADIGTSNLSGTTNPIALVENLCNRFHLVATQLRDRHVERETLMCRTNMTFKTYFTVSCICTLTIYAPRSGPLATPGNQHGWISC